MLYHHVGRRTIAERAGSNVRGVPITSPQDIIPWIASTSTAEVIVTFVINEEGQLLIADRRSEHVARAGGRPVRAAGKMGFTLDNNRNRVTVTRVSNQSTGYCPEPESWAEVARVLSAVGLEPPEGFEPRCDFRRCVKCGSLNLVKGGVFECNICDAELPSEYNCQK